jgi:predicted PurR-regulated permease PerM
VATHEGRERHWRPEILVPLLACLLLVVVLAFLVVRPFILTFVVAACVALLLAPVQRQLTRALRGRESVSAALLVLLTTVVILIPVLSSLAILVSQAGEFIAWLKPQLQRSQLERLWRESLPERFPWLRDFLLLGGEEALPTASEVLSRIASVANTVIQRTFAGLTGALFDLFMFVLTLFFLLRDGGRFRSEAQRISPFSTEQEELIFDHMGRTVKGVLQATVLVPILQGLLAAVGFWIFGVPSPLVWGVGVAFAAFVPLLGSPLGWVPAVVYLFLTGPKGPAFGMALYGVVVISGIDNLVKPLILRGAAQVHPLLAFFSIVGGVLGFGPLGFLIGPVVMSLVISAVRIYRDDVVRSRLGSAVAPKTAPS